MLEADAVWNRRAVVPPPAGHSPIDEVGVGAREAGRTQGGDDRDVVGRIVDGGQHRQQFAHRVGGPHQRPALDAVRDVMGIQRPFELRERRPRRHEDGDVVEAGRPATTVARQFFDLPAVDLHLDDQARQLGCLALAQLGRLGVVVGLTDHDDRRAFAHLGPERRKVVIGRLRPLFALGDDRPEDTVDPFQQRLDSFGYGLDDLFLWLCERCVKTNTQYLAGGQNTARPTVSGRAALQRIC